MPSITYHCPICRKQGQGNISVYQPINCPHCQREWGRVGDVETIFAACPVCQCRQFYTQKDFNQALGCLVMLIGIVLVPWTYGLSLPVFWLVDVFLYRKVPTMVICYKCGAEFRGLSIPGHFKAFIHSIGHKYDRSGR